MTERAAISGDFADLKTVKSRATVQIIIEVPIEHGAEIVRMFGFPQASNPVRVAVARLAEPAQIEAVAAEPMPAADGKKRHWQDFSLSQRAAIRCNTLAFWKFLNERGQPQVTDAESAAEYVRSVCGVHSRRELNTNERAARLWSDLDGRFETWLAGVAA